MTLEERLNEAMGPWSGHFPIEEWNLCSALGARINHSAFEYYTYVNDKCRETTERLLASGRRVSITLILVNRLIGEAALSECLTSPSEYVREYRRWYEYSRR